MSDSLPAAARAAAAIAAKHADDSEAARKLAPEVVSALVASGLARHFVPSRWGGADGSFTDLTEAVAAIGEGCASAAWCAGVYSSAARMGVYLPEQGQAELWAQGPDVLVVGALIPGGTVEKAAGGWLVTGAWPFTSGVDHADWALVCGLPAPGEPGGPRFFAVPRADFAIQQTWFNVGMRGTGSNTLVLDRAFVPEYRSFLRSAMQEGRAVGSAARCHTAPIRAFGGLTFAAPALGAARGALRAWTANMARRSDLTGRPFPELSTVQLVLARSAGEVDAAALLLDRVARLGDEGELTPAVITRGARDYALAVDLLVGAVERLFRAEGARGQAETGLVQRAWRDVHCAAGHVGLQFDTAGAAYATAAFAEVA
ncbi:hydrolase [Streptomyces tateyamensis]|uniref:Hydrolase n=1 Tax=Streptomyces tateyamensis TaxID=565073 RepID=A0A2V4PIS4_9ACTN|nr:acyl-CoA dehydrogenase family protein [Streptomyces tateyamensis]PYC83790.1 hydrolase [Streptomyces tateyamensis]